MSFEVVGVGVTEGHTCFPAGGGRGHGGGNAGIVGWRRGYVCCLVV